MFYTVYKITNNITKSIYIGKHQSENLEDGYFGSGKILRRSINKHGKENFTKEILFIFNSEQEMNEKEKELVTEEFCKRKDTYNLCEGGRGGFSYLNRTGLNISENQRRSRTLLNQITPPTRGIKLSEARKNHLSKHMKENNPLGFKNKNHSEESKLKMSNSKKDKCNGKNNSQYGSFWITNGKENKKSKDAIPEGWYRGRVYYGLVV